MVRRRSLVFWRRLHSTKYRHHLSPGNAELHDLCRIRHFAGPVSELEPKILAPDRVSRNPDLRRTRTGKLDYLEHESAPSVLVLLARNAG